jgi:uncharacterized UBP type Zn finger protein
VDGILICPTCFFSYPDQNKPRHLATPRSLYNIPITISNAFDHLLKGSKEGGYGTERTDLNHTDPVQ